MWQVKMMQMFDVDVLPRRGKQHLAVRRTFGEQPNAIRKLSVLQREFVYDTLVMLNGYLDFFGRNRAPDL